MRLTEDDRGDLRAGTWGGLTVGALGTLGLLLTGHIVYALVGLVSALVGVWLARIALVGFMYPLASTASRIVTVAAGERPSTRAAVHSGRADATGKGVSSSSPPQRPPAYSIAVNCGCGAALTMDAKVSTEAQRAMLTSFFPVHDVCVARALEHAPAAPTLTITVTCVCGAQVCVDVVETSRPEMQRTASEFIAAHRNCIGNGVVG